MPRFPQIVAAGGTKGLHFTLVIKGIRPHFERRLGRRGNSRSNNNFIPFHGLLDISFDNINKVWILTFDLSGLFSLPFIIIFTQTINFL